jgi:hypothetical protein
VNVNFTYDTINWGSGVVDTGKSWAYLDTKSGTVVQGNWTTNDAGLVVENIGNINFSLNLTSQYDAAGFVAGTSPAFQWLFANNETGSCYNVTALDAWYSIGTTAKAVCAPLQPENNRDELKIHLNLSIPYNSKTGQLSDTITATAWA